MFKTRQYADERTFEKRQQVEAVAILAVASISADHKRAQGRADSISNTDPGENVALSSWVCRPKRNLSLVYSEGNTLEKYTVCLCQLWVTLAIAFG